MHVEESLTHAMLYYACRTSQHSIGRVAHTQVMQSVPSQVTLTSLLRSWPRNVQLVMYLAHSVLACQQTYVTPGLGLIVPKKTNKWRMIMYLSVPAGDSINSKDDFSLDCTSIIDDAITVHWQGCKYGKKSAFRMVPVRKEDWRFH